MPNPFAEFIAQNDQKPVNPFAEFISNNPKVSAQFKPSIYADTVNYLNERGDSIKPAERNIPLGWASDILKAGYDFARGGDNPDKNHPGNSNPPGEFVAHILGASAKTLDSLSWGDALAKGAGQATQLTKETKDTVASLIPSIVPAGRIANVGVNEGARVLSNTLARQLRTPSFINPSSKVRSTFEKVLDLKHGDIAIPETPQSTPQAIHVDISIPETPQSTPQAIPEIKKLADAVRSTKQYVPGSIPTTAQVTAEILGSKNVPLVQAEKAFGNTEIGRKLLTQREVQNNAARVSYLNSFDKPEAELQKLINARRESSGSYFSSLKDGNPVDASPILEHIDALSSSGIANDPVVGKTLSSIRNRIDVGIKKTGDGETSVNPEFLDGIRQNLREIIADSASNGAVKSKQEANLRPLANTIIDAIDGANTGYRANLAKYAEESAPIRTIEAARDIRGSFTGALSAGGDPSMSLSKINLWKSRLESGDYKLHPEFANALENLQKDIQRSTISNSLRFGGSDTVYNNAAEKSLLDGIKGKQAPMLASVLKSAGALTGALTGAPIEGATAGFFIGKTASETLAKRLQASYADALMHPEKFADMVSSGRKNATISDINALRQ